jgi:hypothetical protein
MKKVFKYISISVMALFATSCDKGFDEMNIKEIAITGIDPAFILNQAIINTSPTTSTAIYEMTIVQQMVSPNSGVLTGANFNQDNRALLDPMWTRYYRTVIRNTKDIISQVKDKSDRSNLYQMTRIVQAYAFMVMTDSFGDIPYSEAGLAYISANFKPKYDSQEAIYTDLVKELTEASAALSASGKIETADILYGGDITKWKKLGYSLLLRAGMRLSEVSPDKAKSIVATAASGGVMSQNSENFVVKHDANYQNPNGGMLNSTEANNWYLAAPFVNQLKSTNDPRLKSIAVRYVGAASGPQQSADKANRDPAVQTGMPMGYDNGTIPAVAKAAGLASFYDYSQADRTRIVKTTAPQHLVTASQTQLLLAEAVQRGYITGNASDYYAKGIALHMQQMADHDASMAISQADIDKYITENPFQASKALEQIGVQYWISSFLNGPEAFANFRRTGFPKLTPNPYPLKDIKGEFINRLTYQNSEISVNSENVKAAIARMGADNLDTKVWWDK